MSVMSYGEMRRIILVLQQNVSIVTTAQHA